MTPIAKKKNLFALTCLFLAELSYYRAIISFPRPVSCLRGTTTTMRASSSDDMAAAAAMVVVVKFNVLW